MKIRRFNESEALEIEDSRCAEIVEQITDFFSYLKERRASVDELINELEKSQGDSKKGNDQIDDTIAALRLSGKGIDELMESLDSAVGAMNDYSENGRKYLYSEDK
jgi:hypothetical protein